MKKIGFITIIFFALLEVEANSISKFGLAYSRGEDSSKNITTLLSYNIISNLDLRFEYNRNISDYKDFLKADINRYALFATYTQPLAYSLSITPKIGLVRTQGEFETLETIKTISDSSTNFTYGLELNYNISDTISTFIGYTDYGHKFKDIKSIKESNINSKNVSFGFKFDLN